MRPPRSVLALVAVVLLVAVAFAVPATRALLDEHVVGPIEWQAGTSPSGSIGYTVVSLMLWALVGAVFAWAAFELVFQRWRIEPDRRFFLSLMPLLLFGPLYHALLSAGALQRGTVWAYLAAEPLVYLTTALLAVGGLAAGRRLKRPHDGLLFVGLVAAGGALVRAVDIATPAALAQGAGVFAVAAVAAAVLAPVARRLAPEGVGAAAAFAVVAGHALDGATTWLSLRDPFGWGFSGFRESNPISEQLVEMSNGWPYFAVKLALPLVLLHLLRSESEKIRAANARPAPAAAAASSDDGAVAAGAGAGAASASGAGATPVGASTVEAERPAAVAVEDEVKQERLRAFLLFAVFVLGYGPGMSNLMQVILG